MQRKVIERAKQIIVLIIIIVVFTDLLVVLLRCVSMSVGLALNNIRKVFRTQTRFVWNHFQGLCPNYNLVEIHTMRNSEKL